MQIALSVVMEHEHFQHQAIAAARILQHLPVADRVAKTRR
jgi:hypothetical protein